MNRLRPRWHAGLKTMVLFQFTSSSGARCGFYRVKSPPGAITVRFPTGGLRSIPFTLYVHMCFWMSFVSQNTPPTPLPPKAVAVTRQSKCMCECRNLRRSANKINLRPSVFRVRNILLMIVVYVDGDFRRPWRIRGRIGRTIKRIFISIQKTLFGTAIAVRVVVHLAEFTVASIGNLAQLCKSHTTSDLPCISSVLTHKFFNLYR